MTTTTTLVINCAFPGHGSEPHHHFERGESVTYSTDLTYLPSQDDPSDTLQPLPGVYGKGDHVTNNDVVIVQACDDENISHPREGLHKHFVNSGGNLMYSQRLDFTPDGFLSDLVEQDGVFAKNTVLIGTQVPTPITQQSPKADDTYDDALAEQQEVANLRDMVETLQTTLDGERNRVLELNDELLEAKRDAGHRIEDLINEHDAWKANLRDEIIRRGSRQGLCTEGLSEFLEEHGMRGIEREFAVEIVTTMRSTWRRTVTATSEDEAQSRAMENLRGEVEIDTFGIDVQESNDVTFTLEHEVDYVCES